MTTTAAANSMSAASANPKRRAFSKTDITIAPDEGKVATCMSWLTTANFRWGDQKIADKTFDVLINLYTATVKGDPVDDLLLSLVIWLDMLAATTQHLPTDETYNRVIKAQQALIGP